MAKEQLDLGLELDFEDVGDDGVLSQNESSSDENNLEDGSLFNEPNIPEEENGGSDEDPSQKSEDTGDLDINDQFESLLKDSEKSDSPDSELTEEDKSDGKSSKDGEPQKTDEELLTVAFAKLLKEQGDTDFDQEAYLEDVKENGEAQAFLNLMEKTAETKAENFKSELDSYAKEYVELREAGFSKEDAGAMVANKETVDSITEESLESDESLQEDIVREVLRLRKFSDDEVDEHIQSLKDTDRLKSVASKNLTQLKGYHEQLITHQKKAQEEQARAAKEEQNEYLKSLKSTIDNTDEIFKGKKINSQTKNKLYDMITKPVKMENGQLTNSIWAERAKDPKTFDMKLAYLMQTGVFKGDLKTIAADARTKALNDIETRLKTRSRSSSGSVVLPGEDVSESKADEMSIFLDD